MSEPFYWGSQPMNFYPKMGTVNSSEAEDKWLTRASNLKTTGGQSLAESGSSCIWALHHSSLSREVGLENVFTFLIKVPFRTRGKKEPQVLGFTSVTNRVCTYEHTHRQFFLNYKCLPEHLGAFLKGHPTGPEGKKGLIFKKSCFFSLFKHRKIHLAARNE